MKLSNSQTEFLSWIRNEIGVCARMWQLRHGRLHLQWKYCTKKLEVFLINFYRAVMVGIYGITSRTMPNEDTEEKSLSQVLYQSLTEMTGSMDNLLIQPEGVRLQLMGLYPFIQGDNKLLIDQYLRPSERCWSLPSAEWLSYEKISSTPDVVIKSPTKRRKTSRKSGKYKITMKDKLGLKVKKKKFRQVKTFRLQVSSGNCWHCSKHQL